MSPAKPRFRSESATCTPAWPAPTMTTWATARASDLGRRHIDLDLLDGTAEDQLAPESAAPWVARRDGVLEHLVLVLAHLGERVEVGLADVHVAGRAHGLSAALADDAAHAFMHGRSHEAGAGRDVQDVGAATVVVEGHLGHRFAPRGRNACCRGGVRNLRARRRRLVAVLRLTASAPHRHP